MKKMQSLLGRVHDCDVWLEDLERFAGKEKKRTVKYFGSERAFGRLKPGIEYLVGHRHEDRERFFEQSRALWKEIAERGLVDKLHSIIQAHGLRSRRAVRVKVQAAAQDGSRCEKKT
jgi:hypothetical protein